jgi:hypothetical protein
MSYQVGSLIEVSPSPVDPARGSSTPTTAPHGPSWTRPVADKPYRVGGSPPRARVALLVIGIWLGQKQVQDHRDSVVVAAEISSPHGTAGGRTPLSSRGRPSHH